jgi:hypothetical protein
MKISIKTLGLATLVSLGLNSCSSWLDVNTSPNNPETAPVELVFPRASLSTPMVVGGQYAILGSIWSQQYTQSASANQYKTWDSYNLTSSEFGGSWNEMYIGLVNLENIIKESELKENWSYYLMATTLKAYTFQVLVDLYDKVPYSDAFKGKEGNISPKWDNGDAVYDDLIKILDKALAKDLNATTVTNPGVTDLYFKGDMNSWKAFANTLKLKIYLRQTKARPTVAQAGVKALIDANTSFLTSDAAISNFQTEKGSQNPMYGSEQDGLGGNNLVASKTLLDYLSNVNDPRIPTIYKPYKGSYVGQQQGDYLNTAYVNTVSLANLSATAPVRLISLAESNFLQAEALERYYAGVGAKAKYDAGVSAAFVQSGLTAAGATTFTKAGGAYEYTAATSEQKIALIITQKWISLIGNGLESFFEYNRTGYPKFFAISKEGNSVTSGRFPRRLLYPTGERDRNPSNTPKEEPIYTPVWWAK